jgi:hypothetical protein
MSSMRFNAPLDTFHAFTDVGGVADSLRGILHAVVKFLFIVKRSCIHKVLWMFSR